MPKTSKELMAKKFDAETVEGIHELSDRMYGINYVSQDNSVHLIQKMLLSMIGNMKANAKLRDLRRNPNIAKWQVDDLMDVTFRTRHMHKIWPYMDRIWGNFRAVENGIIDESPKKITLEQFGILYDLSKLRPLLRSYKELGLIHGNPQLKQLLKNSIRAKIIVSRMENALDKNFQMPTGAVVLDRIDDYKKIKGFEGSIFDKFFSMVTKYRHAAKGIILPDSKVSKVSHMAPKRVVDTFSLRNYLYSDIYKIKLENLIDKKSQELLKKHYGTEWLSILDNKFSEIERQIHDMEIDYSDFRLDRGAAKLKRSLDIATVQLRGGHKNLFFNDHSNTNVRDQIFGRGKWAKWTPTNMICSEFVGRTIIASIQELNDVIKADLQKMGVTDIPNKLILNPISKREKLDALTPERLLKALKNRNAVELVERSPEFNKLIDKGSSAGKRNITQKMREKLVENKAEPTTPTVSMKKS